MSISGKLVQQFRTCVHLGNLISQRNQPLNTTSLSFQLPDDWFHLTECDYETVNRRSGALGDVSDRDAGPLGPEGSAAVGRGLSARPPAGWGTQERGSDGGAVARGQ